MKAMWRVGFEAWRHRFGRAFGKPRPAVVVQAVKDLSPERITVALITSDRLRLPTIRIALAANEVTGVVRPSDIAVDNIQTFSITKVGRTIGSVSQETMMLVDESLRRHLGL